MEGRPHHERVLDLGKTPALLIQTAGFPDIPLAIKASVVSKSAFDHGISTSFLKRLPAIVRNPKAIFNSNSATANGAVVILTFEVKGSNPIIIPIRPNCSYGRGQKYNFVTSIYGKEGPDPEIKWTQENLLIWRS